VAQGAGIESRPQAVKCGGAQPSRRGDHGVLYLWSGGGAMLGEGGGRECAAVWNWGAHGGQ